jgi:Uncharacterized homolog of the cytoplasmic domain of flagellar protein FhlB
MVKDDALKPTRRSAIALTYEGIAAPRVAATGDGELDEAIIAEARAQGVFVLPG